MPLPIPELLPLLAGVVLHIPPLPNGQPRKVIPISKNPHGSREVLPNGTTKISVRNRSLRTFQVQKPTDDGYTRVDVQDYRPTDIFGPSATIEEDHESDKLLRITPQHPNTSLRHDPTITAEYCDLP